MKHIEIQNIKIKIFLATMTMLSGMFFCAHAQAATYYIDYVGGADNRAGTAIATSWKRCPGMVGFTGTYTHANGDRFIFKGGVTWPNIVFPLAPATGGNSANPDYYGVDNTYYTGASWARPIFDSQGKDVVGVKNVEVDMDKNYVSWITFDNFEFKGHYWSKEFGWGKNATFAVTGSQQGIYIKNCYFHGWSHAPYNSGANPDSYLVINGSSSGNPISDAVENCIFDGSDGDGISAYAVKGWGKFSNNIVHDMQNAYVGCGVIINGNIIYNIHTSYDPTEHENAIESWLCANSGSTVQYIYDNIIHDTDDSVYPLPIGPNFGLSGSVSAYVYNNIFYNISYGTPITIDYLYASGITPTPGQISTYVWNNTIVGSTEYGYCIRLLNRGNGNAGLIDLRNNHCVAETNIYTIDSGISANTLINNNNILTTHAQATLQGFSVSNSFAPTSQTNSTVNAGVSLSSACPSCVGLTKDVKAITRPQGSAWDVGAYEYVVASGSDTTPPSVPANLAGTAISATQINLSWTVSTDNIGVTGYKIYRNGTQVGTSAGTNYSDTGLTASTQYSYTIAAYDAAGNNSTQSSVVKVTTKAGSDTTVPTVPNNLAGTAISATQINLSWTASTDNIAVTGYKIYRNGTQVGISAGNSYGDIGLAASTQYSYTIAAYDAAGNNSTQGEVVKITTNTAADTQAPTVPNNLAGTAVSDTQVNLSWAASTDNIAVTGYKIYRNGTQIGTTAGNSYSDTGLVASTQYSYTIAAYDAAGNTSAQGIVMKTTTRAAAAIDDPSPSATYPFNVTVSDGKNSVSQTCNISIISDTFVIYPVADLKVLVGKKLAFSVYAASSKKDYNGMNFVFSGLSGLSCSAITPTSDGRVRCDVVIPATTAAFDGAINITASNAAGDKFTSQNFSLNIYNNPPVMQPINCPDTIRVGQPLLSCVAEATDPDGHSIKSISASGLPSNVYLTGFSTDKTCEAYFEKIINAVIKKRYEQNKTLIDITGYNCSDCVCRPEWYDAVPCAANKASNMAIFGFTPADFGGNSFVFDENEHEGSSSNCPYQDHLTLDGCGGAWIPFYVCANLPSSSSSGNRGTLQGTPNTPGIYPISFTATDQFGSVSNPLVFSLKINSFCGDGIKETPNTEGKGGPGKDGYEDCDGTDGVPASPAASSVSFQYGCNALTCVSARDGFCGDNKIQTKYGEKCDFGNDINCCAKCNWITDAYTSTDFSANGTFSSGSELKISLPPNRGVKEIIFNASPDLTPDDLSAFPLSIVVVSDISNPPDPDPDNGTIVHMRDAVKQTVEDFYAWSNAKKEDVTMGAFGFGEGTPGDLTLVPPMPPVACDSIDHSCYPVQPVSLLNANSGFTHKDSLKSAINKYNQANDGSPDARSYIDIAIPKAQSMLSSQPANYLKYMIILTDGCSCNTWDAPTTAAANAAKAAGIKIYTVAYSINQRIQLCGWSSDNGNLASCDTNNSYYYNSDPSGTQMTAILRKIQADILSSIPQEFKITARVGANTVTTATLKNNTIGAQLDISSLVGCSLDGSGCDKDVYLSPLFTGTGNVTIGAIKVNLMPPCKP
jgi:chitodextrinase